MSTDSTDRYWDPYDRALFADPYPRYQQMRDEEPLYRNEELDFYAVSRFEDVERVLVERNIFVSRMGNILEQMKSGNELPPGTLIFEDPPVHTARRGLLSRVFTPKRMLDLEPQVRDLCRSRLELLEGRDRFDFVADLGSQVPMRVIGMLLGIPEGDQEAVRDYFMENLRAEDKRDSYTEFPDGEMFADYIDWRRDHPSDDLMTALLNSEFEDADGTVRCLTRREILTYVTVLAGAGNETTNLLIGWTGKLLGEHPDARRAIVADRSLVPGAIEEVLRVEPIAHVIGRTPDRDVEIQGEVVPAGSIVLTLPGSANHDERVFADGDRFDIHRGIGHHLSFGYGAHFCLGAALARLEGRVVLDEVLNHFPDWEVDLDHAALLPPGANRGWSELPVVVG